MKIWLLMIMAIGLIISGFLNSFDWLRIIALSVLGVAIALEVQK